MNNNISKKDIEERIKHLKENNPKEYLELLKNLNKHLSDIGKVARDLNSEGR